MSNTDTYDYIKLCHFLTYDYIDLFHFLKLLWVSMCPCYIDSNTHMQKYKEELNGYVLSSN